MTNRQLFAAFAGLAALGLAVYFGAKELGYSGDFGDFFNIEENSTDSRYCDCDELAAAAEERAREDTAAINGSIVRADSAKGLKVLSDSLTKKSDTPESNAFVAAEVAPKPLNLEEIQRCITYPEEARLSEIEGKVVLRVLVDEQGCYVKHIVQRSPDPALTAAAEEKISCLRFSPAVQAGKPIRFWVNVPFLFRLK